jgi:hypothetical protein
MPYIKIVLLFCGIAILLAAVADALFLLAARFMGVSAITATYEGWILLFLGWWAISFGVGVRLATVLQIFPFIRPK